MTQEEKQLLLKDLCARLPYGVICRCRTTEDSTWWNTDHRIFGIAGGNFDIGSDILEPEQIKPYLRPTSSMTEEEFDEYMQFIKHSWEGIDKEEDDYYVKVKDRDVYIDWLLAHHFDFRGLIPMGLALEAKEGMYKTE